MDLRRLWVAAAIGCAGCSGEKTPELGREVPLVNAAAPRPDRRPALLAEARQVLAEARVALAAERLEAAALLDAEVALEASAGGATRCVATLRYQVPLTPGGRERLVFQAPGGQAESAWLRLERLEVNGAPASADGTALRWEIEAPAGEGVAEVVLRVVGEVPSFATRRAGLALERELDALPALAKLLPDLGQIELAQASGTSEQLVAVVLPALTGRTTIHRLVVRAEGTVLASGRRTDDGRFAGAGFGLAVVAAQGPIERHAVHGHEVSIATGGHEVAEVLRLVRRGLEVTGDRLGQDEGALGVVVSAALNELGVAALPGMLLLPAPPQRPGASEGLGLEAVLARHPAPQEAYERAVAAAVARLPWLGWGEGGLARLVEHGMAADFALRSVRAAGGDKAGRRALELGWKLPYQLGRMRGAPDPALLLAELGDPALERVAQAKAGLAFEALARTMGNEPWASAQRALWEARRRGQPLTEALVRETLVGAAPRGELVAGLWTRWATERRGDTDVGELRPEVLLEYVVSDGLVQGLSSALLDDAGGIAASPLGQRALASLGRGESLDLGFGVAMLGEVLGESLDPTSRRWLELGAQLFSKETRKDALRGLIDVVSGELGVPESERTRLGILGDLVMDALDAPGPAQDGAGTQDGAPTAP